MNWSGANCGKQLRAALYGERQTKGYKKVVNVFVRFGSCCCMKDLEKESAFEDCAYEQSSSVLLVEDGSFILAEFCGTRRPWVDRLVV